MKLKTALVEAVKQTFDAEYPESDFRDIWSSIEFPIARENYPGIWVDYIPVGDLQIMGVGHIEYEEDGGNAREFTRWAYKGQASFTLVALTSLQRDRLHDEMVRVLAFGKEGAATSDFRRYIENNEFLGINFDWDEITTRGTANTLGTPWQTDDMIYEVEVAMECFGEFISDSQSFSLAPISEVSVYEYSDQESDPTTPGGWV